MKISIAMATYNGEKYIAKQLDSILSQSFSDFELIICDDCSSDSTIDIINKYLINDSRISLFVNKKNIGFKNNFEKILSYCNGEYVAFADQDDIWNKNHLLELYNNIKNCNVICGDNSFIDEKDNKIGINFYESNLFSLVKYPNNFDILLKIILSGNCFQGTSMLIKKSFLDLHLPIPDNFYFHDLWFASIACSQDSFKVIEKSITYYRQHDTQVTKTYHKKLNKIELIKTLLTKCSVKYVEELNKLIKFLTNKFIISKLNFVINNWNKYYIYLHPDNSKIKKYVRLIKFLIKEN